MREAEEAAIARGLTAEALMDQAGAGMARAIAQFFRCPGRCIVFAGKGHNGGDALVAAEHLQRAGWTIDVRLTFREDECAELTQKKLKSLRDALSESSSRAESGPITIVLDGLLGLGGNELLREPIRGSAREINRLRREQNAFVIAVDLPTGLNSDSGETDPEDCVVADFTMTIACAKHGLIVDSALDFVGRIEVIPLADLVAPESAANERLATPHSLQDVLRRRKFGSYKNQFGRIGIVAGSEGMIGAAILTTEGALRAGAGLVHLVRPEGSL